MNKIHLIDLTHEISNQMLNYPYDPPVFIKTLSTIEKNGYQTTLLEIPMHAGTHIDFPAHFFEKSVTSSEFNIDYFYGKALIVKVECIDNTDNKIIELSDFKSDFVSIFKDYDYIIFNTSWSKFWGTEKYYYNYPYLSNDLSYFLSDLKNLKGIGIDTPSVDQYESTTYNNHKTILKNKKIIIENLCNLDQIHSNEFYISCFPIKIKNSDGAPVRVVAFIQL